VVQGGSLGTLEPFTTTVAVEAARPGDVVAIVAQGGTGLESDPGDVAALPMVVAG
jgi:hypothetical protein